MLEFDAAKAGKTLVMGHRGAAALAPENTMVSFEKGLACGADLLELDVHLSLDGEIFVMHDSLVDRTTDGHGPIEAMTASQVKRLDAGQKFGSQFAGERVPSFRELLDWARTRIPLVVELKGAPFPVPDLGAKVVTALEEFGLLDESLVISFHHFSVLAVKRLAPGLKTGILFSGELVDPLGAARAAGADSVRPGWSFWRKETVRMVREAGLTASTWNADDEELASRLLPMGFASIGSNRPDRLRSSVDKAGLGWR